MQPIESTAAKPFIVAVNVASPSVTLIERSEMNAPAICAAPATAVPTCTVKVRGTSCAVAVARVDQVFAIVEADPDVCATAAGDDVAKCDCMRNAISS